MSQYVVSANYLSAEIRGRYLSTRYGGGRLVIEKDHVELLYSSFGRQRGPEHGIRHAAKSVLWINLRIALPWMNRGPVVHAGDEVAVAFIMPFQRDRAMADLEQAGFNVRTQSLWSYSKKSLLKLLAETK